MAEFRDIFRIDVEADSALRKVKDVTQQLETVKRAIISMGDTPTLKNLDNLFRGLVREGRVAREVVANVRNQIADLTGRGQAGVQNRLRFIVELDAEEAIRNLQQRIAATPAIQQRLATDPDAAVRELATRGSREIQGTEDLNRKLALQQAILRELERQYDLIVRQAIAEKDVSDVTRNRIQNLDAASKAISASVAPDDLNQASDKQRALAEDQIKTNTELNSKIRQSTEAYTSMASAQQQATDAGQQLDQTQQSINDTIGNAIVKIIKYRVAFVTMRAAIEALQDSIKIFKELELQLAEIEKVVDPITKDMELFRREAFNLGREFGQTANDVLEAVKIFVQAGLEQKDAIEATRATLVGANAVGLDAKQVTEALISVIFTYNKAVDESITILSKWLAVQARFPVESADLANSLKVIGSAAQVVGVDLDDLAGSVTAINAITRKSGTAIGQSLKTIFARFPKKETIRAFQEIGIAIFKSANQFRDFDDVLGDLAKRWPELDDATKTNIATTIGGIRRYADFIALMDNYQVKLNATAISQKASTEALTASIIELETFSKTVDSAKNVLEELGDIVGESFAAPIAVASQALIDLREALGDEGFRALGRFISGLSAIVAGLTIAIIAIRGFNFLANGTAQALKFAGTSFAVVSSGLKSITVGFASASAAMGVFGTVLRGVFALLGPIAAILSLVATGLVIFGAETKRNIRSIDTSNKSIAAEGKALLGAAEARETEIGVIRDSISKLNEYREKLNRTNVSQEEHNKIIDESNKILKNIPILYSDLTDAANALRVSNDLNAQSFKNLERAADSATNRLEEQVKVNRELAEQKLRFAESQQLELELEIKNFDLAQPIIQEELDKINLDFSSIIGDTAISEFQNSLFKAIQSISKERVLITDERGLIDANRSSFEAAGSDLRSSFLRFLKLEDDDFDNLLEGTEDVVDNLRDKFEDLPDRLRKFLPEAPVEALEGALGRLDNRLFAITNAQATLFQALRRGTNSQIIEAYNNYILILRNFRDLSSAAANNVDELVASVRSAKVDELNTLRDSADALRKALEGTNDELDGSLFLSGDFSTELENFHENLKQLKNDFENIDFDVISAADLLGPFEELNEIATSGEIGENIVKGVDDLTKSLQARLKDIDDFRETFFEQFSESVSPEDLIGEDRQALRQKANDIAKTITEEQATAFIQVAFEDIDLSKFIEADKLEEAKKSPIELLFLILKLQDESERLNQILEEALDLRPGSLRLFKASVIQQENIVSLQKTEEILADRILNSRTAELDILSRRSQLFRDNLAVQEQIFGIEKSLSQQRFSLQDRLASIADEQGDAQGAQEIRLKAINDLYKDQIRIIEKELAAKIENAMRPMLEGAAAFKDALTSGIGGIPDVIGEGFNKRLDLQEEISDIEFDLLSARREGDQKAIFDAEQRLKTAKEELNTYKAGLFEIRKTFETIFGTISSRFWKKITDDFVEQISKISLGDSTLAEQFGEVFSGRINDLGDTLSVINTDFISQYKQANSEFLDSYREILGLNEAVGREVFNPNAIPPEESGGVLVGSQQLVTAVGNNTQTLSENINATQQQIRRVIELTDAQKVLQSSLTVLAGTIVNAFSVRGGAGSQIGSTIGSIAGQAIANNLSKTIESAVPFLPEGGPLSFLGPLAGPLGLLAGGLLGSLVGGIFGGGDREEPKRFIEAIDRNTEAVIGNTLALKQLDQAIFNAPTGFNVPVAFGGGFGGAVNITINAQNSNARQIATEVSNIISGQFGVGVNTFGTRGLLPV